MRLYVYKWVCKQTQIYAWGIDPEGHVKCMDTLQEDFILLESQPGARPLPGMREVGSSFVDEYGGGITYPQLMLLPSSSDITIDELREIGESPERFQYRQSFLTHVDSLHKYFILKNIPYHSGWFDMESWTPLVDQKELPPITLLVYDVECVAAAENRFPHELNANDYIASIAFIKCTLQAERLDIHQSTVLIVAQRTDTFHTDQMTVKLCASEKQLLQEAIEIFSDPTIHFLSGFNTSGFDDKYLIGRYYHHGLEKRILKCTYPFKEDASVTLWYTPHQLSLDVYKFFKGYQRYPEHSLDFLAKEILQDKKKPMDHKLMRKWFLTIQNISHEEVARLIEYNMHDAVLTLQLLHTVKLLDFTFTISALCYLNIERVILAGKSEVLNGYIIIEGYRSGYLVSRPTHVTPKDATSYQGAVVALTSPGIYSHVSVLDFLSLYPSLISAKNLSPSTCHARRAPPTEPKDSHRFFSVQLSEHRYCWSLKKTEHVGMFPLICQRLLETRENIKTKLKNPHLVENEKRFYTYLQWALKIINNSIYGNLGAPHSPFYCKLVAEAVTAHARTTILLAKTYFESIEVPWIFIDTDSLFIVTSTEANGRQLTSAVNAFIDIPQLTMEFECFYTKIFFFSKKKYYGRIGTHYKASGFELRKKDFPTHCKTILQTLLILVLEDTESILSHLYPLTDSLFRHDLCYKYELFSKGITLKALYKYKPSCTAPHVQYIKRLGEKTAILEGRFVPLHLSPLADHQKKGYALGLVDENNRISGQPERIPVHIVHGVKGACHLFDKIYAIVFQIPMTIDDTLRKRVTHHFKQCQENRIKYNLVIVELKCIFQSTMVTFSKRLSLPTLGLKRKPNTIDQYFKKMKTL